MVSALGESLLDDEVARGAAVALDEAERCQRVALMDHARVLSVSTPDALRAEATGSIVEVLARPKRRALELLKAHAEVSDVEAFGERLHATLPGLDAKTRDRFWQPSTVEGSTRRLGFDGPSPDGSGATADVLDARAVGHTGYTGTSVWIDPHAEGGARIFVLLSNRVHPVRTNDAIKAFRQAFHRAVSRLEKTSGLGGA